MQWLVVYDTLKLMPYSEANKTRLRQRFALMSVGFQKVSSGLDFVHGAWDVSQENECNWPTGIKAGNKILCINGRVTSFSTEGLVGTIPPDLCWLTSVTLVRFYSGALQGSLPSMMGWWTNLTSFYANGGILTGTIPSTVGAWKALVNFDVSRNQLGGSLPSAVANWTAIGVADFSRNNFTGTMPAFDSGFYPKKTTTGNLATDCLNTTDLVKIVCDCCNACY
jgi:hypothetical protein